jgi:SAM-dependent methyltransferase
MAKDHRRDYHQAWSQLTPPLRPHPDVVAAIKQQLTQHPGRVLLLGVTPELADIAAELVAVDVNDSMVAHIWPGNTAARSAVVGDWREANFRAASFAACVGDISLGALSFPDDATLVCRRIVEALSPGGRFVCRVFLLPEVPETVDALRDAALNGSIKNFHAFKIRLGMALAGAQGRPSVGVDAIYRAFTDLFDARDELVRVTGWDRGHIDTIDFYSNSSAAFRFATRDQLLSVVSRLFRDTHFVSSGTYELAERSPLLVADRE